MTKGCVILGNGRPPATGDLSFFLDNGFPVLICADGGANVAYDIGGIPDYIIGDLDSISESILDHYKNRVSVIKIERQDDTDVEKCLKFAIEKGFTQCALLGVTGDRLDHTLNNIGLALKYGDKIRIFIYSEQSLLEVFTGTLQIDGFRGETVSIYGFDSNTRITTKGLKYPLNGEVLPFGVRDGTSNEVLEEKFEVTAEGGTAILIRNAREAIKGGYFYGYA